MNRDQAYAAVREALATIAPEADMAAVDPHARLRDELDLDSLDFLTLVQALYDSTGVDIPEIDYGDVGTLDDLVAYLVSAAPAGALR